MVAGVYFVLAVASSAGLASTTFAEDSIKTMTDMHPIRLAGFKFREAEDSGDQKLLANVHQHGWHIVAVSGDDQGPGYAFTVGLYLRTLQPEILIMGVDVAPSGRVLNAIGEYLMTGGQIVPEERYPKFVDGRDVIFARFTTGIFTTTSAAQTGSTGHMKEDSPPCSAYGLI